MVSEAARHFVFKAFLYPPSLLKTGCYTRVPLKGKWLWVSSVSWQWDLLFLYFTCS